VSSGIGKCFGLPVASRAAFAWAAAARDSHIPPHRHRLLDTVSRHRV
jgi:hypothetical protein